jgi:hypothetical protein
LQKRISRVLRITLLLLLDICVAFYFYLADPVVFRAGLSVVKHFVER